MTIFYPDVSPYQAGVSFAGCPIIMVKATEGTGYVNPDFVPAQARAKSAGSYFCAYHFMHEGNGAAQARYAHSIVGKIPLMLDVEVEGSSKPGVQDIVDFMNEYRSLGGIAYALYLPDWYWSGTLGSPSLAPVKSLGMFLVSSNYTTYTNDGPGWNSYGGMTPLVWQYTETGSLHGASVDYNAFNGTLEDFEAYMTTGKAPGNGPVKPVSVAYPKPEGLKASAIDLHVTWDAVTIPSPDADTGKPVASYTVEAVQENGKVAVTTTVSGTSAVLTGLVPGWTYNILVWANGGPSAPPHASFKIAI